MKFASTLFALAAAAGASAGTLGPRANGIISVEYYPEPDCKGEWLENNVFVDRGTAQCVRDSTLTWKPYVSWKVTTNGATRPLKAYSEAGCADGTVVTVQPGALDCVNQLSGSVQFEV